MKVVIDNNVAIDALNPRQPFDAEAKTVFRLFGEERFEPYVTANSLTDIFYVLRRGDSAKAAKAKSVVANLMSVVSVISLTETDCADALDLPMDDFEDAVTAICAKKIEADCIVSRDNKFAAAKTAAPVISPAELIERLNQKD